MVKNSVLTQKCQYNASACMLYIAADPMHKPVIPLPFVKCTQIKITACLLESR